MHEEPLASPVFPGEIVAGRYCVERVLGVGGMGVVVRARHTTLDQIVAIKFLVANRFDTREQAIARFLDEARAAARIESDYVCRVFDVGTLPNGIPFMVMEHLEGRDLDEEIAQRGQLSFVEAVDYVLQAADALAAAHQLGIVHRDIKPANLFLALRPDGTRRVKVLDFGISKAKDSRRHTLDKSSSLGTPAYMSPEQVRGDNVDARADIWALGAILYELVTGQMAFGGADVKHILDHVMKDDPCPMTALRRNVPPELEAIVMRCLARDRDSRWPSAAKFARALGPFGSVGIVAQLASVNRELGSLTSISMIRTGSNSVQPMVANVRPTVETVPDAAELLAREGIVQDWSKQRARQRTGRVAFVGLVAVVACLAGAALALRFRASADGSADGSAARTTAGAETLAPPAAEPVPAVGIAAGTPSTSTSTRGGDADGGVGAGKVYPATNSVQSAHVGVPRGTSRATPPARPAPKAPVNRVRDDRN